MAVVNLKSANITNRDATPYVQSTGGAGAPGRENVVDDYVTTGSGDSAASTYRMVSVPSQARIKTVEWEAAAMTAGAFDVGVYYAVNHILSAAGAVISVALFGSAVSAAAAVVAGTDITNESGTYTIDKRNQPLWQAAGLAADPGGNLDIVFTCTTGVTTGALMGVEVHYAL